MAIEHGDDVGVRKRWLEWIDKTSDTPSLDDRQQYAGPRGSFLRHLLVLLRHKFEVCSECDWSRAAWTSRERSDESDNQSPSHGRDRVRDVAFGPQRRSLWVGNLRERQVAGNSAVERGPEGGIVSRSEIRNP